MSERYFRVKARVTFTGEWFIPIDEYVQTPVHAIEALRDGYIYDDPENLLEDHRAEIDTDDVWVTDETGEKLT